MKRKIALGPWFVPAFQALRAMRGLRGTSMDPFVIPYVLHRLPAFWPIRRGSIPSGFRPNARRSAEVRIHPVRRRSSAMHRQSVRIDRDAAQRRNLRAGNPLAAPHHKVDAWPLITLRPRFGMPMIIERRTRNSPTDVALLNPRWSGGDTWSSDESVRSRCAKVAAALYAVIGLVIGAFFSLFSVAGGFASAAFAADPSRRPGRSRSAWERWRSCSSRFSTPRSDLSARSSRRGCTTWPWVSWAASRSIWNSQKNVRRLLRLLAIVLTMLAVAVAILAAVIWGPPLFSGALFLLVPGPPTGRVPEHVSDYEPLHQGHVDIATGLYIREDEDIVLGKGPRHSSGAARTSGRPRLETVRDRHDAQRRMVFDWRSSALRVGRAHSRRRVADPFQSLDAGPLLRERRLWSHRDADGYDGALLGWTGVGWRVRLRDSTVLSFKGCGPDVNTTCSLLAISNADGKRVSFTRDQRGLVKQVNSGSERIRIELRRAAPDCESVRHRSAQGRVRVQLEGTPKWSRPTECRKYAYGAADELLNVNEPGREVVNRFDAEGRLIHQTVRQPNRPDYRESFVHGEGQDGGRNKRDRRGRCDHTIPFR